MPQAWQLHEAEEGLGCRELSSPEVLSELAPLGPLTLPAALPGAADLTLPCYPHRGVPVISQRQGAQ